MGGPAFVKLSSRTLLALANRVRAYCGSGCTGADGRAIELFETSASYHYRLREVNPNAPELAPLLRALLSGTPLSDSLGIGDAPDATVDAVLSRLSAMSLFRLRNAPYARHGRPFKSADLQSFFYDAAPPFLKARDSHGLDERKRSGLFPQTVDAAYADTKLTPTDHANIATIRRAQEL